MIIMGKDKLNVITLILSNNFEQPSSFVLKQKNNLIFMSELLLQSDLVLSMQRLARDP